MTFNKGNIAFLFLVWSFFFLLGGTLALTLPCILLVIATVLYIVL